MNDLSLIKEATIRELSDKHPEAIYESVKLAYASHGRSEVVNPPSYFMKFPDKPSSRIIALPAAIINNPRVSGIKWIASNPENITNHLKRASAILILNDYETGYPFACMEGALISSLRTVYSALLAAELCSKTRKISRLGIIGTGNISSVFLKCSKLLGWEIDEIRVYDSVYEYAETFQIKHQALIQTQISLSCQVEDVVRNSDVILFATTAKTPYLDDFSWFLHNPLVLHLSLRDLSPDILIKSNNIVDDLEHILAADTSPHLTQKKYGHSHFINGTLGDCLMHPPHIATDKPIIVSPMGMGMLDLAVGYYIYTLAQKSKLSIELANFFNHEQT